jgi:hypothetical protein
MIIIETHFDFEFGTQMWSGFCVISPMNVLCDRTIIFRSRQRRWFEYDYGKKMKRVLTPADLFHANTYIHDYMLYDTYKT